MTTAIQLLCVGKLKGGFSYLQPGIDDYLQRMRPFANVSCIEIPDETISPSVTEAQVMEREAERILPWMNRAAYRIALSERGEQLTSQQLATAWEKRLNTIAPMGNPPNGGTRVSGSGPIILVVGGALGLSSTVLESADWTLSLSKLTFPHPLVRLIALEQLYRLFKILHNQPYHK